MPDYKNVKMLYGTEGIALKVPEATTVLQGRDVPALANVQQAVLAALDNPIGCSSLRQLLAEKKPRQVAITISDITRPVPNRDFLPTLTAVLNQAGISDRQIVIIIGTGMHRPCTRAECESLVGTDILQRIDVINHMADRSDTLIKLSNDPPVSICRQFAAADFRIVTGYIEPHFMAGFSGGRKGVCPALVDLQTIQRFHGVRTLADPLAENGILEANPCHRIALEVARQVGVDFLFNVAITRDKKIAGIYCGDLERAHHAGCQQVAAWTTAQISEPFDMVISNGGGYPLDQTFYQTVKGICGALPALHADSTLLICSSCTEQLGSQAYSEMMLGYANDWRRFLADIQAAPEVTKLDQWEFQMHTRVLQRIGVQRLWFVSDGIPAQVQKLICVTPILGQGMAPERTQNAINKFVAKHSNAKIAVIPAGPYTMLKQD